MTDTSSSKAGRRLRAAARPSSTRRDSPGHPPSRSIKRQRNTASPISVASSLEQDGDREAAHGAGGRGSTQSQRGRLFDKLEAGSEHPAAERVMRSADGLNDAQLKKCFEILHACGGATDPNATLSTTRQSIDGFLEAIFNDWSSVNPGTLMRSELDFLVEADVVAGRVCVVPAHQCVVECVLSDSCTTDVTAVATYSNNPPVFRMEFTVIDAFTGQPETFCPIARGDIRWVTTDWIQELRKALQTKIVAKIHKFNKYLAIWQARRLVMEWAKGSLSMGDDVADMGFLGRGTANAAIAGLGKAD